MTPTEKRRAFRKLLVSDRCHYPGSVFDAVSSRLAQDACYDDAWINRFVL